MSRKQLEIRYEDGQHLAQNLGRLPLRLNGQPAETCPLRPGDLLQLGDRVLLLVSARSAQLDGEVEASHPFGGPDSLGWVGEGPVAWWLRDRVRFVGRRNAHVLVLGESGSGKELAARGLHASSSRRRRPLVSRSAATIPEGLADAELFGNLASYPNPGMPARPGLVGEADGSTLFLDEFGELPLEVQARLLRVLDEGEYTRLGEARPRRSDLRLVAATNRDPEELKHDVLARFKIRLDVPGLRERVEDVPLLAVHLLRGIARQDRELASRFFEEGDPERSPRMALALTSALVAFPYTTHVRQLEAMLWQSVTSSRGDTLQLPPGGLSVARADGVEDADAVDPATLDAATIQAALDRRGGRQEPTWRDLGLSSRHVLARLVKKHGLKVRGKG